MSKSRLDEIEEKLMSGADPCVNILPSGEIVDAKPKSKLAIANQRITELEGRIRRLEEERAKILCILQTMVREMRGHGQPIDPTGGVGLGGWEGK